MLSRAVVSRPAAVWVAVLVAVALLAGVGLAAPETRLTGVINIDPPHISTDKAVKYDFDVVYVRAPRKGDGRARWAEVGDPRTMEPGADLMLLHPNGREEVLVEGGKGSVTDPMVSFDGEWVYYSLFHDLTHYNHGFATTSAGSSG